MKSEITTLIFFLKDIEKNDIISSSHFHNLNNFHSNDLKVSQHMQKHHEILFLIFKRLFFFGRNIHVQEKRKKKD